MYIVCILRCCLSNVMILTFPVLVPVSHYLIYYPVRYTFVLLISELYLSSYMNCCLYSFGPPAPATTMHHARDMLTGAPAPLTRSSAAEPRPKTKQILIKTKLEYRSSYATMFILR